MAEYWINGKLTDLTLEEAKLKLIEVKGFGERYFNIHSKWTEAVNVGIEAIERAKVETIPMCKVLEILEDYKLRIPPTVFYELKADIVNFEEERNDKE